MMPDLRPTDCERTRQWVSAALDCELSQFERVLVAAHLSHCAPCRAFEARVTSITAALRTAQPERLRSEVYLPPRRRFVWRQPARLAGLGSTAVVTAAIVLFGMLVGTERASLGQEHALVGAPLAQSAGASDPVIEVRRSSFALGEQSAIAYGSGGIGAYKPPLLA